MEYGDVAFFLELLLYLEAARSGDVLEVHAAEAAGDEIDGIDYLVDVLALYAERERVDAAEALEEHALALHDGHSGLGADIAETENGGAVGDDEAEIVTAGELIAQINVLLYLKTGLSHAGSVGEGKILLGLNGNGGDDLDLALPFFVKT